MKRVRRMLASGWGRFYLAFAIFFAILGFTIAARGVGGTVGVGFFGLVWIALGRFAERRTSNTVAKLQDWQSKPGAIDRTDSLRFEFVLACRAGAISLAGIGWLVAAAIGLLVALG